MAGHTPTVVSTMSPTTDPAQNSQDAASVVRVDIDHTTKLSLLDQLMCLGHVERFKSILETIDDKSILGGLFTDACYQGKGNFVKMMLDCGVDVNIGDNEGGWNGLAYASMGGHESIVQLLLDVRENALLATSHACQQSNSQTVTKILEDTVKPEDDASKLHKLKSLFTWNDLENFKVVLETVNDKSSLHDIFTDACVFGKNDFVKLMLDFGVDVNIRYRGRNGSTGLMFAARFGHESTIQLLLARGANVLLLDRDGPGHTANQMCNDAKIRKMLENAEKVQTGAAKDIQGHANSCGESSSSIVTLQVHRDSQDVVNPLLANLNDVSKLSLLKMFLDMEDVDKFEIVFNSIIDKSKCNNMFINICSCGRDKFVKSMIDSGVDVNICDRFGSTGLIEATAAMRKSTVQLLLTAGANVLLKTKGGHTARYYCHSKVIEKILKNAEKIQETNDLRDKIESELAMKFNNGKNVCKSTPHGDEIFVIHIDGQCQVHFKNRGTCKFVPL